MKTMKKLFAICLVLFAMFTLASCVEEQQPDCEHQPGSWAVSETEHWKVCGLCNEEVEKGEHKFGEFEVIIEPSVGVPGVQARKCEECKYVDRQEIPAIEVETGVAEADFTVFVKVPAGWEKSYCYFWSETGAISSEHTVGWPGKEMTLVDADQNIWAFIVPAGTDHVIFNNGAGVQTVDIAFATKLNLYVLADEAGADGKFTSLIDVYESSFEGEINKYPTNAAETFKTIYVQLPLTWVGHNIHYWGSAAGSTWPGDPLEVVDAEKGLYKFELSSTVTGFLFGEGDGLAQTGDLAPEEGVDGYIVEVVDGVVTVTNCKYAEGELQPITTYTVYAQLPEGWTAPNAYFWDGKGEAPAWPGLPLTHVEGNIWSYEISKDITGLIFNNEGSQTENITAANGLHIGNAFIYDGSSVVAANYVDGKFEAVQAAPVFTEYYVRGGMNSWGTEAAYLFAYDEATDTATLTVTFAEGDEFKIATAGWEKEFNSGTISAPSGAFGGAGNIVCLVAGTYEIVIANVSGAATCTFTAK